VLKGLKWIVYSNVWVSVNAVAFYLFIVLLLNIPVDYRFLSLLFLSTLFAYNFQRLLKNVSASNTEHRSERHVWIGEHQQLIKVLTLLSGVGTAALSFWILPLHLILISIPALLIVMFYTRRSDGLSALRNIPFLKIALISFVWVFMILVMPLLLLGFDFDMDLVNLSLPMLLYVAVLCIPFDIRDRKVDMGKLKTIPTVVGVKGAKGIGVIAMLGVAIWGWFSSVYAFPLVALIVIPSLIRTEEDRPELFFTGWIEGQFLSLLLLQLLVEVI
jgi:hypothetical protein